MEDASKPRLRAAQVGLLYRNVGVAVGASALIAATLAGLTVWLGAARPRTAALWTCTIMGLALLHLWLRTRYGRAGMSEQQRDLGKWAALFTGLCLLEGVGWGWASVLLVGTGPYDVELMVMLVSYANAAGAIPAYGSYRPAFWAMFLPTTVPFLIVSMEDGRPVALAAGTLGVLYVVLMGGLGLRYERDLRTILLVGFENADLAARLAQENARAEAANVAKSRFLAAASHDLRQPVHALSLFTAALQRTEMGQKAREIVDHIQHAVAALDGLFGALLNVSELDAGIVVARPVPLPLAPLLERLAREQAGEAAEKGLVLRLVPSAAWVLADPVLLERVLRNLISNAVRHTVQGRVVIGCRGQAGARRIEVWDTGPGIPEALQERVFEEFYQHGNPERDRSKGLGLGLAIVRRLSAIMGAALTMRSVPGQGSCFAITVPGAPSAVAVAPTRPTAVPGRHLVLIIDDEAAIQTAMCTLLEHWGYDVLTAGSEAEMLAALESCPQQPALLICDYRLRGTEDGIAVIRRLQQEYNDGLPALLVTGDTAPGRLLDARASGLMLLHKPVPETALRTAMAQLIQGSADAAGPR